MRLVEGGQLPEQDGLLTLVSKRLGHASTAITGDLSSHLLRSTEHETANNTAALVPAKKAPARTLHAQEGGE